MERNDTRHLKRDPDGRYRTGGGQIICDICAIRNEGCPFTPRTHCEHFMPALGFNDQTGMQKVFNTIRVGKAWPQRLSPGQPIGLWCPIDKTIFGWAEVLSIYSGRIAHILVNHAGDNHLFLDQHDTHAQRLLYEWLRQNYGPRIIHKDTTVTAIYLRRLRKPPPETDFEGHEAYRIIEGGAESSGEDTGDA